MGDPRIDPKSEAIFLSLTCSILADFPVVKLLPSLTLLLLLSAAGSAAAGSQMNALEVDRVVAAELERLGQEARPGIDDHTFCRRLYLDAIGRIPTLDELDHFIGDKRPDKRARLIDKLLSSKGYNSHWYNYWADLLRVKYVGDNLHHPGNFSEWVKESVRTNKPYDKMVHELVNASGKLYEPGNGATGFYARETMPLDHLANSVKTFLGLSIECAQCHDDPFDEWMQQDFYKLAAFTSGTHLRVDPLPADEKATYAKDREILKNKSFDEWIVFRESVRVKHASIYGSGTGYSRLPHDYEYNDGEPHQVMATQVLFGEMPEVHYTLPKDKLAPRKKNQFGPEINSREALADWMTSRDNPMFTKATVNRLWHRIMGTELAGPVGDLTVESMGDHPALTEKLIEIMQVNDFDMKAFLSVLFNSKTYQSKALALQPNSSMYVLDGPVVRRLPAEVIVDSSLSLRTENPDASVAEEFRWDGFTHFYDKSRNMTVQDFVDYSIAGPGRAQFQKREEKEAQKRNRDLGPKSLWRVSAYGHHDGNHLAAILMGQSTRELIDSENTQPDIPQILFLMNGPIEDQIVRNPNIYIHRKLRDEKDRAKRMEMIWKAVLCRLPKPSELALLKQKQADIMWALLNSNEFRFTR